MKSFRFWGVMTAVSLTVCAALLVPPSPGAPPGGVIKVPELVYRTGPYAPAGSTAASAREDYFAL